MIHQGREDQEACQAIGGSALDSWLDRYKPTGSDEKSVAFDSWQIKRTRALDAWSDSDVSLYTACDERPIEEPVRQRFFERATILRQSEHAHIQPVIDFYLDGTQLYWVVPELEGTSLETTHGVERLSSELAVQLASQFTSIVSFFSMQAPAVLPPLDASFLSVQPNSNLCAIEFQTEYFFGQPQPDALPMIGKFIGVITNRSVADGTTQTLKEFGQQLCLAAPAQHVSTLSKLKNALKHLEESAAAQPAKSEG